MKQITYFIWVALGFSIFSLATSCSKKGSEVVEQPVSKSTEPEYQLAWTDDFNGTQLDMANWEYMYNNQVRHSAINDAATISVANGNLILQPFTDIVNGVTTHHACYLATKKKDYLYGRFEAKISFVNEPASWSAFWVNCGGMGNPVGNPKVAGTEMDIVESLPNDGRVQHAIHWDGYGADHKSKAFKTGDLGCNSGNYHIYVMEWTPDYYKFYVDGNLTWTFNEAISQRGEYMIFSTEIADDYWTGKIPAGGYGAKGQGKTIMKIDYVKYYALKK